jgi:UDP-4-amino-4,6-dideoxy-N-acetyl-beta-L-altrosamine transaminase
VSVGAARSDRARTSWLPYARQGVSRADIRAVAAVLRSDWLTSGPAVDAFEAALAREVGARFAVAFSSGTAALHGAVAAAGVGAGDEGITSPLTFCASANCLVYEGARPVFCDVADTTLTMDPAALERRITRRTRVVIPVDYAGHPADLDAIRAVAKRHGLLVIEDACHALGATYRGRPVGAISDMTVFSFHPVKHITTAEGGMVATNSRRFAERLRRFRAHGIVRPRRDAERRPWYYEMVDLGFNYRIPDVACALGLSQLSRLDRNLERRRAIAARYAQALAAVPGVRLPEAAADAESAWHLYPVRIDPARFGRTRDDVVRGLRAANIGVTVHYIPVTLHPYYRQRFGCRPGAFPVAERAYRGLVSLPMFPAMRDCDVDDVVRALARLSASGLRARRRA